MRASNRRTMHVTSTCRVAGVILLCCCPSLAAPAEEAAPRYQHYLIGNPADVVATTSGLIVLQGGGDDVDENFVRMGARAGGGDFVVLRASGEGDYNDYIYSLCHCDSVETIVFSGREAAFDPYVFRTIRNAEALFIAGGDQSRYVRFWQGTPVEDAINYVAAKPAPIGGTSAGMAILGEFSYSAMTGESLTSAAALADPFAPDLTLERDFIQLLWLRNVMTDPHLWERDRIGRTVALLARLVTDGWTATGRAIAADRETAVHIDPRDGRAEVFATPTHPTPYVYFMRTTRRPDRCAPGEPLIIRNVAVYRVAPGGEFDLGSWTGRGGIAYWLSASEGAVRSSRGGLY
jgi:cyanophycinase-like exopeptidase